ncbi:MAG: hypothetical protein MJ123_01365 [Lachnospiraceae bacterium]|nr:hypothetical protein [Lachnospiraceae bacterium]
MAIIECSHCKELYNEDEQFCPYCGEESSIRLAPVRERRYKPQKGRHLILGLPLGKWIAALIFLVAALLIVLCVYICLSLSGKIKDNKGITDNLNSSVIESLTTVTNDSSAKVLSEDALGTTYSSKVKGYNLYSSNELGFKALIPENFKVCMSSDNLYVCSDLSDDGSYTIPCMVINKIEEFNDEVEFLQDRHSAFAKSYSDDNFDLLENLVKFEQGDKTVYEFQFKYTNQGYEIMDTRRAIKVDGVLYSIATIELADKTLAVSDDQVIKFIESFKIN